MYEEAGEVSEILPALLLLNIYYDKIRGVTRGVLSNM